MLKRSSTRYNSQKVKANTSAQALAAYPAAFKDSWLHEELNKARNFKQWFKHGLYVGALIVGIEQWLFKGKMPWTIRRTKADHECLKWLLVTPIDYPKPDGQLTFDRMSSSSYRAHTMMITNRYT